MIIRKIVLTDFGIFGGTREFDLAPVTSEHFARPVTLFRGKNGVGKTTLVEAMRLCLHGRLVLGNRVGQQEFEDYLLRRLHRGLNGTQAATQLGVGMTLDFVEQGRLSTYHVARSWNTLGDRVKTDRFDVVKDNKCTVLTH